LSISKSSTTSIGRKANFLCNLNATNEWQMDSSVKKALTLARAGLAVRDFVQPSRLRKSQTLYFHPLAFDFALTEVLASQLLHT
jgi:hypothetical protein